MRYFARKLLAVSLGICLLLTGCGSQGGAETPDAAGNANVAMGRYVETEIPMPEFVPDEFVIGFEEGESGLPLLYSKVGEECFAYQMQEDASWKKMPSLWLTDIFSGVTIGQVPYVLHGEDGNYYVSYSEGEEGLFQPHVMKSADKETFEEIAIEAFQAPDADSGYYKFLAKIGVMQDGSILTSYYSEPGELFDAAGATRWQYFEIGGQGTSFTIKNGRLYALDEDSTHILVSELATGEKVNEVPVTGKEYTVGLQATEDGTLYMLNTSGIHRLLSGGSTWETVVDGALTSLSMPTIYNGQLLLGEANDFYGLFNNDNGNALYHYKYDETVPSVPSVELSLYTLENNSTIRQAAALFQRENPDVKLNIRVLMTDEGATTAEDNIRALNTELLDNKGPDLLLLDGMPVDSYIEKGVLADLSDALSEVPLLETIKNAYITDGKLYAIPSRIGLPVFIGKPEMTAQAKDLESLANAAEANGKPFMGAMHWRGFTAMMFRIYGNDMIEANGSLNQEKLVSFLENIKQVSGQMELNKEERMAAIEAPSDFSIIQGAAFDYKMLKGLKDSMWAVSLAGQTGVIVTPARNQFQAYGLLGVNANSKNAEIAKKFVATVVSVDTQSGDLYDGFPVNREALSVWQNMDLKWSAAASYNDTDEYYEAEFPNAEERKMLLDMCATLTTPVPEDDVLLEMILNETEDFLDGNGTAEETAEAIIQSTQAYLAE